MSIDIDKEATAQDVKNAINAQKSAFGESKITQEQLGAVLAQYNSKWDKEFTEIVF